MAFAFDLRGGWLATVLTILIASIFVHFAARMVIDRSSFFIALLVVILGTLASSVVAGFVPGTLGLILGAAMWALVAAVLYRVAWMKGAIIGLVAAVLWVIVTFVVAAFS